MKIFKIVKQFFQSKFSKRDISDRLRTIAQKFDEVVLPALEKTGENFSKPAPVSKYAKGFVEAFQKQLPSSLRRAPNMYFAVAETSLKHARQLITLLEDLVRKEIPDSIYIEGITYQKATILRLVELLDFTADYASRQLCYYVAAETDVIALGRSPDALPFTKAEEAFIVSHQSPYFRAIELFYGEPKAIITQLHKIPDVLVTENEAADLPTIRQSELDPMNFGIIPIVSSIWLFFGELAVDWEYERYERSKKEKRDIEMRIEVLKQKNNGVMDARAEAILNGYNRELALLRDHIESIERKIKR